MKMPTKYKLKLRSWQVLLL